jgi:uncharacterized protein YqeY
MIDINKLIMGTMKSINEAKNNNDTQAEATLKVSLETYKLLKAKILEFKTSKEQKEYNDSAEITIIKKMIDDRNNSADIYKKNNRPELADDELKQVYVLTKLLPKEPTKEDIENYLKEHYPGGIEKKEMGNVIKEVKNNLLGADGKLTSQCVMAIINK